MLETALVVDLNLRRRSPDELLWQVRRMRIAEVYSGSRGAVVVNSPEFQKNALNVDDIAQFTDIQLTESLAVRARAQLVERFARELRQRLMEMF